MMYVNARAIIERNSSVGTEIIVQFRTKKGEECYELPGGRINLFESFFDALKREVKEETGLDIVEASGQDTYIKTDSESSFTVECFRPYAVYQTLKGPFDSLGVYFKCNSTGNILSVGDDTKDIKWINIDNLKELLCEKGMFSDVDRAAAVFYLKEKNINL